MGDYQEEVGMDHTSWPELVRERWQTWTTQTRYEKLLALYGSGPMDSEKHAALQNVLSKFAIDTWDELPSRMREFLRANWEEL